ncbi:helix-turn-helix domain-containing protein [Bacteroidales bacterium OttesenSCG-928-C03]|nr:helix-turn-helix domain-containing protein [Bacteroidales bacterium OttesenSCG-928-C03]MDL2326145.1 helix-turn-helix domain-containing protein [Bacteroidales bacterium OttesenSCG-928-A14]
MDVVKNIIEIRKENGINQELIANALNVDVSAVSNIENGKRELKVNELGKIANALNVDLLYLFTYPKKYVDSETIEKPERISVIFEVSPDKRDILLNLVTGDKK